MQVLNVSQSWECNSVVTSSGAISDSCSSKPGMIICAWWYRIEISTFSSVIWWWTSIWMPFKFLMAVSACLAVAYRTILNLLGYKQKKKEKRKKAHLPLFHYTTYPKVVPCSGSKGMQILSWPTGPLFPNFRRRNLTSKGHSRSVTMGNPLSRTRTLVSWPWWFDMVLLVWAKLNIN